jgi:hypothetical protein
MQYTGKEVTMTGKWRHFGTINKVAKCVWFKDIDKNKLKKLGYNQKPGNYQALLLMKQPVTQKSMHFEHKFFLCTLSNHYFMNADYL